MGKSGLLNASDIHGVWSILPTPSKPDASDWRATNTVDLDETARAVEGLIAAGANGILSMGTLGECESLTWEEKKVFMQTIVETARGRVPVFVGTTTLNTRDTIEQTRYAHSIGADGTMLGIPMWCNPCVDMAVQYYKDVAEAVPEMNIAIYANTEAFKFDFPRAFWARVSEIRQVVAAKYIGIEFLLQDLHLTKHRMKLLPLDYQYYAAARMDDFIDAFWSSGTVCGPLVSTTLRDKVIAARRTKDWTDAHAFQGRLVKTAAPFPEDSFKTFSIYNVALEKGRIDAAGWMNAGPVRPPYNDICPASYLDSWKASGQRWAELHKQLETESSET